MKTIWITGASSGIGQQLAREFAARGFALVLLARRGDRLAQLCAELAATAPSPSPHRMIEVDVSDAAAFAARVRADMAVHGVPDIFIANAGISQGASVEHPEDVAVFEDTLRTNVTALFNGFACFASAMKQRGSGTLVGISSVAGVRGLPGTPAYSASKAAATAVCESVRVELRGTGVKVVTIAPGFIDTPMTAGNPYPMPFLMPVQDFARQAADAILAGTSYRVIPWQMAWVARLLRILPDAWYDAALAGRGRKPRKKASPGA